MAKETRQWICDACGRDITDAAYRNNQEIIEVDDEGFAYVTDYDFCEECRLSLNEWLKSRKEWGKAQAKKGKKK